MNEKIESIDRSKSIYMYFLSSSKKGISMPRNKQKIFLPFISSSMVVADIESFYQYYWLINPKISTQ